MSLFAFLLIMGIRLKAIYEFDSDIRNLIASIVEDIEIYLKSSIRP